MDLAYEMVFAALIGGIVGAKLWFLAENGGPLFSGTGLTFYGGLIGGALAVIAWTSYRGVLDLKLADAVVPSLAAAYAIGRIGCQFAGDGDYGKDWDGPWAMAYPNGTVPIDTPVHPTPIYETLAMGLFAIVLWRLRDRWRPGVLTGVYLIGVGVERFLDRVPAPQRSDRARADPGAVGVGRLHGRRRGVAAGPAQPRRRACRAHCLRGPPEYSHARCGIFRAPRATHVLTC